MNRTVVPLKPTHTYMDIRDEYFNVRSALAENRTCWDCSFVLLPLEDVVSVTYEWINQFTFYKDVVPAFLVGTTLFFHLPKGIKHIIANYSTHPKLLYSCKLGQLHISKSDDLFKLDCICKIICKFRFFYFLFSV